MIIKKGDEIIFILVFILAALSILLVGGTIIDHVFKETGISITKAVMFYFLGAIIIFSAIGVVTLKNIVHSAFLLVLTFVSIGCLYMTLKADFVAVVQILLYAGAVSIMLIFAIMVTSRTESHSQYSLFYRFLAFVFAIGLLILIIGFTWNASWIFSVEPTNIKTTEIIGRAFFNEYIIPFEVASVILLMALIGAIVLSKREIKQVKEVKEND